MCSFLYYHKSCFTVQLLDDINVQQLNIIMSDNQDYLGTLKKVKIKLIIYICYLRNHILKIVINRHIYRK